MASTSKAAMLLNRRARTRRTIEEQNGAKVENSKNTKRKTKRRFPARLHTGAAAGLTREKLCKLLALIAVISFLDLRWIVRPLEIKYFGNKDIEGGEFGAVMDRRNRRFHRRRVEERRRDRLKGLGIVLPSLDESRNENYLTVTSEILTRRAERKRKLKDADRSIKKRLVHCQSSSDSLGYSNATAIPHQIIQIHYGPWFRPQTDNQMTVISFDEHDMSGLVREQFSRLIPLYEQLSIEGRILVWSLCALYRYGGYIFGKSVTRLEELISESDKISPQNTCQDFAAFKFTRQSLGNQLDFLMLAASPKHPILKCALDRLQTVNGTIDGALFLKSLYCPQEWVSSEAHRVVHNYSQAAVSPSSWESLHKDYPMNYESMFCCNDHDEPGYKNEEKRRASLFVKVVPSDSSSSRVESSNESQQHFTSSRTKVSIREPSDILPITQHAKVSVREVMRKSHCDASWRCNRCLHNPVYGTYESCDSICDSCFIDLICIPSNDPPKNTVTFKVVVREPKSLLAGESRIPRVIHQTWFEDLSVERYPQLARVQSSWKNAGYAYRFYTDSDAREFIATNFPTRFLEAYDALVPGAFKADLFRSLVLLKEGGIYADADVLLGSNLDTFITPNMSFFVPLDLVGADYDEEFCLWNGLLGAAPGHPILVEVVEWLVNMIMNRADAYDFERELCRDSGKSLPVWKVRQGRLLLLSGPCALGMAANRALGKSNPVARIQSGWLTSSSAGPNTTEFGDSLVLKGDKFDMNAFRFTDIDRNLIVASTDMIDLTTTPLEARKESIRRPAHYSDTEALDDVFGTKGVYIDNMVTNELIKLEVAREYFV
jgi:hypothetical protein